MSWTDEYGITKKNLIEHDIAIINTFTLGCYYFSFGCMTPVDRTSVLVKTQYYYDNGGFKAAEFVEFLQVRKIPFRLRWIPCRIFSMKENWDYFKEIVKLNKSLLR